MDRNKVDSIFVYYTKPFLDFVIRKAYRSRQTFEYICSVMKNKCTWVYEENEIQSTEQCILQLYSLPALTTGGYLDGKDSGCRVLHATLADINDFHCPHISFKPISDGANETKCQESSITPPKTLFSEFDLMFFANTAKDYGINSSEGYKLNFPAKFGNTKLDVNF